MKLTGHMVLEDNLLSQITSNGAVMPNYEYFHIPGIDWLSRARVTPLTPLQVSSVAHQLGKKQVLTESYALCGHNVSFEELRLITEAQFVRGVNLICPHLEGYSLRGIRKRDYPPAMYYQQPWWKEYSLYIERLSRIGVLLTDGRPEFDTLLIHPQSTAWTMYDNSENAGIDKLNEEFLSMIEKLERKHILFHLGDERIMELHARVDGAKLVIGSQSYSRIIIASDEVLFDSTRALLDEFTKNGGIVTNADDISENRVCENPALTYTKRIFDDFVMHYFVNETEEEQISDIPVGSKYLDINTGEFKTFSGKHTFAPYDSLVVIEDSSSPTSVQNLPTDLKTLPLSGEWDIEDCGLNSLTIDTCDYYFDGELIEKNAYVLDVGDRANALERKVNIKLCYHFNADFIPEEIYAAVETPEIFDIAINGRTFEKKDCGFFRDRAFRMLDISNYVKTGENEIVMTCCFEQSPEVYKAIKDSRVFESEKNKLRYDMEIEGIFIVGKFGVAINGKVQPLARKAIRVGGDFKITAPVKKITLQNIEQQGFAFFSGRMTLKKTIELSDTSYRLKFQKSGINAVLVKVNGSDAGNLIWNPLELDLSNLLKKGENEIELTIVNNLRNLLGPHHLEEGECLCVGPGQFYKNDSPFCMGEAWNDDYCLVETSVKED